MYSSPHQAPLFRGWPFLVPDFMMASIGVPPCVISLVDLCQPDLFPA
jgi:hypothetical protein